MQLTPTQLEQGFDDDDDDDDDDMVKEMKLYNILFLPCLGILVKKLIMFGDS